MPGPARPTLRCLREDLVEGWDDASQRAALKVEPLRLPSLHELEHPLVRHVAGVFTGKPDEDLTREGITGLTDPMWWKAKTGARWRGAVWEDEDGQAWLCAAGWRYEGEARDFYRQFMAASAADAGQFLPTDDDRARLRLEQARDRLDAWQRDIHERACEAFRSAADTLLPAAFDIPALGPDGHDPLGRAVVTVVAAPDDDDPDFSLVDVVVEFAREDRSRPDLSERADIVVLAALEPKEQSWDVSASADGPVYSFMAAQADFDALLAAVDPQRAPCASRPGALAHYAYVGRLTEAAVEGNAVGSMCGKWYVPRQDHANMPVCPDCARAHAALTDPP